jgi:hypothetical protein
MGKKIVEQPQDVCKRLAWSLDACPCREGMEEAID